jgi:cell division initiation protein
MDLTARDVHEKQFHDAWRGYNQEEVDDFLDLIAENIDRLQRENHSFQRRIQELDQAVSQSRNTEEMLKKTLLSAQKAANDAIATAKAKAEQLISDAEIGARRTGEEAHRRAQELDKEHATRKRELETSIERLQARESELKRRLAAFFEQQKRSIEGLETPSEGPPGAGPAAFPQAPGERPPAAEGEGRGEGDGRPVAERPAPSGERPVAQRSEGNAGVRSLFRREENPK